MFKKGWLVKVVKHEYSFVLLMIGISLIIGFFTVKDYGVTTDEPVSWDFATQALGFFVGKGDNVKVDFSHGGGFLIPGKIGQLFFSSFFSNWLEPYSWHMVYFIVFQLSVFFMFLLARKFVGKWGANFSALLYATQPLLWGHSFMNPKDAPFMALFLGAIVLGIYLSDNVQGFERDFRTFIEGARAGLLEEKKLKKPRSIAVVVILLFGLVLLILIGEEIVHRWLEAWITKLYTVDPASLTGRMFSLIASNTGQVPLEDYISKTIRLYDRTAGPVNAVIFLALLGTIVFWLFPVTAKRAGKMAGKILGMKGILPPAILLGICASARTMGVVAFGIVSVYWLFKNGRKSVSVLIFYLLAGTLVGFLFWPHLWESPGPTYLEYIQNVFNFQNWHNKILFEGEIYNRETYPNHYLPKLLLLQLTEPALVLSGIGMVIAAVKVWRKEYDWILTGLIGAWFVVPVILAVILHPVIYNSFRHFLFILPPVFIFAGICADFILEKFNKTTWRILLVAVLLLPGLIGIVQLHPFEYIYFNSFAGGVDGAFRQYELDYWFLSHLEAVEYLNENAIPNAYVSIDLGKELVPWFVREDFHVLPHPKVSAQGRINYMVVTTNLNTDLSFEKRFPNMKQVYSIERYGVPLAIVYEMIRN